MRLDAALSASRFQRSSYDAVRAAFASQRCVLLDGRAAIATAEDIPARHRRYVAAGWERLPIKLDHLRAQYHEPLTYLAAARSTTSGFRRGLHGRPRQG